MGKRPARCRPTCLAADWTWPAQKPYRHFSGEYLIRGRQIVKIAARLGFIPPAKLCTICGTTAGKIEHHNEDYARPLLAKPNCRSCHRKLHLQFRDADQWRGHWANTATARNSPRI